MTDIRYPPVPPAPPPRVVFAPTSFWNVPLPANTVPEPQTGAVVLNILADSKRATPNFNTTAYSATIYVADSTTPLVPCRCTVSQPYAKAANDVSMQGVPIPVDFVEALASDTDAAAVFYDTYRDELWEFWRFRANTDPATLAQGVPWAYSWGGRMSHVSQSPGHYVDRWASWRDRKYPDLPTDPVKADEYEQVGWGSTATSLPLLGGILSEEDVLRGRVDHAVGLSTINLKSRTHVWPAQRNDGNNASVTICEGMRLRLPLDYVVPSTFHPIAALYAQAMRDYGCVMWDKSGALGFRAEPAVHKHLGGTPKYKILAGFPWDQLELLPVGSDALPNG